MSFFFIYLGVCLGVLFVVSLTHDAKWPVRAFGEFAGALGDLCRTIWFWQMDYVRATRYKARHQAGYNAPLRLSL